MHRLLGKPTAEIFLIPMQKHLSRPVFRRLQWYYSLAVTAVAGIAIAASMSRLWVPLGVICAFPGAWMAWKYMRPNTLRGYLLTGVLTSLLSHLLCVAVCVLVFGMGANLFGDMSNLMEYVMRGNLLFLPASLLLCVLVAFSMWQILVCRRRSSGGK